MVFNKQIFKYYLSTNMNVCRFVFIGVFVLICAAFGEGSIKDSIISQNEKYFLSDIKFENLSKKQNRQQRNEAALTANLHLLDKTIKSPITISILIENSKGIVVFQKKQKISPSKNTIRRVNFFIKRLTRNRKTLFENGKYYYEFTIESNGKRLYSQNGDFFIGKPPPVNIEFSNVITAPTPFSPNNDGFEDSTTISSTISILGIHKQSKLQWQCSIFTPIGNPVKKIKGLIDIPNNGAYPLSVVWDGKDTNGEIVDEGVYLFQVYARIKGSSAVSDTGQILIDLQTQISVVVSPGSWTIGDILGGTTVTMDENQKIIVTNNGNVLENFSLNVINPPEWECSQEFNGPNTYVINSAFASHVSEITWNTAQHALSTEPVLCDDEKFAGNQTGKEVMPDDSRTLWMQFISPTNSTVDEIQSIRVIITASPN